jgi:hypothetical protein
MKKRRKKKDIYLDMKKNEKNYKNSGICVLHAFYYIFGNTLHAF